MNCEKNYVSRITTQPSEICLCVSFNKSQVFYERDNTPFDKNINFVTHHYPSEAQKKSKSVTNQ